MVNERVTERVDGAGNIERTTERDTGTAVVERRGMGGALVAIVLLAALAIGAWFLFNANKSEARKDNAVAAAAKDVGDSAKQVGDSVEKAVDGVTK